jgi:hypothetical protein
LLASVSSVENKLNGVRRLKKERVLRNEDTEETGLA